MSVHIIYYKDGAKMMRPVLSREEYLSLRGSDWQKNILQKVRSGNAHQKSKLIQMNYSCLPNEDGSLRGSKTMSTTVGMDIDHIDASTMEQVKENILARKDELGLLMLELSARGLGYHLVFRRRPDLSQEENLRWAPPSENDTERYIQNVCLWTGFGGNERLTETEWPRLVQAMARQECGVILDEDQIQKGYALYQESKQIK